MKTKFLVNKYHIKYNKYFNNRLNKHPNDYIKKIIHRKKLNIISVDIKLPTIEIWNDEYTYIQSGKINIYTNDNYTKKYFEKHEDIFIVNNYDINIIY